MGLAIAWPCTSAEARAQRLPSQHITVHAQSLQRALADLARQTGVSIGTDGTLPDIHTHPCRNAPSAQDALDQMLAGTGFAARRLGPDVWRIVPAPRERERIARSPAPLLPVPDPIIVTAAKQPLPLRDIPRAVSVLRLSDTRTHCPSSEHLAHQAA